MGNYHHKLIAWQRGRQVAIGVYLHARKHWRPEKSSVLDQLRRSALSVTLNIAEGVASGPGARCRHHLRIAYGSAVETTEILDFLIELGECDDALRTLRGLSQETEALLYALWLRSKR